MNHTFSRRNFLEIAVGSALGGTGMQSLAGANQATSESLPIQFYNSLSELQRSQICLPVNHPSRFHISNWWYIHDEHRINKGFEEDQLDLIQQIFDSYHHPDFREKVNRQIELDQYGKPKNAPSVGFFGTPEDEKFEFLFTGHHVTRRGSGHTDQGSGFGGGPIFYGHHAPGNFHETKNHPGNPYWYQGLIFNEFVQTLDGTQQETALQAGRPRSERGNLVVKTLDSDWPGLACRDLSDDQKAKLIDTMRRMLAMFRPGDVVSTIGEIQKRQLIDNLYISYFGGKFDIGGDKVWDTWQIEGPEMVWYFRGEPHIHGYFLLKS